MGSPPVFNFPVPIHAADAEVLRVKCLAHEHSKVPRPASWTQLESQGHWASLSTHEDSY